MDYIDSLGPNWFRLQLSQQMVWSWVILAPPRDNLDFAIHWNGINVTLVKRIKRFDVVTRSNNILSNGNLDLYTGPIAWTTNQLPSGLWLYRCILCYDFVYRIDRPIQMPSRRGVNKWLSNRTMTAFNVSFWLFKWMCSMAFIQLALQSSMAQCDKVLNNRCFAKQAGQIKTAISKQ